MVITDMMRVQQVLLNFQSNALKFTPDRGTIKIHCKFKHIRESNEKYIKLRVIDNGIGISEQDQMKLFKLFGYIQEVRNNLNT